MDLSINFKNQKKIKIDIGKHAYSHHAQIGLTFLSNQITLNDEFYDRVRLG